MTTAMTGKIYATYDVTYEITGEEHILFSGHRARVILIEGRTTFADIPKILATKRGVSVDRISILDLHLVTDAQAAYEKGR